MLKIVGFVSVLAERGEAMQHLLKKGHYCYYHVDVDVVDTYILICCCCCVIIIIIITSSSSF